MKLDKHKKILNRVIMLKLKEFGVEYQSMDQASAVVAGSIGLDIDGMSSFAARIAVVQRLNGEDSSMARVQARHLIKKYRVEKQERKSLGKAVRKARRPSYLPGIPSASTLERDIKEFYNSWEWKQLSYEVKLDRGRTCECCGAKAPDVKIITDHIKPIRHNWHLRLEPTNLQILCDDCNRGKGSRDETDFRQSTNSADPGLAYDPLDEAPLPSHRVLWH